jgi:hypothetical protein
MCLLGKQNWKLQLGSGRTETSARRASVPRDYHLPDLTFMTMWVSGNVMATGEQLEQRGVELYTF